MEALAFGLFLAILLALGYLEYVTWQECLRDHSWFYCMRTIQ